MNILKKLAVGLGCRSLVVIFLFSTLSAAAQEQLPESEIAGVVSGNTLFGKTERGADFHVHHSPNGQMSGQARLAYYDVGTWAVSGKGEYCRQWTNWRDGARDCFVIFKLGNNQYQLKGVNYHYDSKFTIHEGDPKNLKGRI